MPLNKSIDITQPPLSAFELKLKRISLADQMAKHELLFRQHLYSIIVLLVFSLAAVVGAVAYWVGLPSWSELIVVVEGAGVAVHVTVVIAAP
jgi:hypothetical protein